MQDLDTHLAQETCQLGKNSGIGERSYRFIITGNHEEDYFQLGKQNVAYRKLSQWSHRRKNGKLHASHNEGLIPASDPFIPEFHLKLHQDTVSKASEGGYIASGI